MNNSKIDLLKEVRYNLFGSIKTGLAIESSDMDIALTGINITQGE